MSRCKPFLSLFALSLVGGSSLAAAPSALAVFEFEAGDYPAVVSGSAQGPQTFLLQGGEIPVECQLTTFTVSGEMSEAEETLDLIPKYEGCVMAGVLGTTITVNGCAFRLRASEELAFDEFAGTADLVCPEGKKMLLANIVCQVELGGPSASSEVGYENVAEGGLMMTAEMSLTGLRYTKKSGAFCPVGSGEKQDGTYQGYTLVEATHEAAEEEFGVAVNTAELCKSAEINPCKTPYIEGTVLAAQLFPMTNAVFKYQYEGAQKTIGCSESNLTATTGKHVGRELSGTMNPLVFPVCEKECSGGAANAPFEIRILPILPPTAAGNGKMNLYKAGGGPIFVVGCDGKHACAYTSAVLLGSITGGKDATWVVSDTLGTKLGVSDKGCGASLTINAQYLFYKPVVGMQPQMWVSSG